MNAGTPEQAGDSFDSPDGRTYSGPATAPTPGQPPGIKVTHDPEIPVRLVRLPLCDPCVDGQGEQCHTPGCALFLLAPPERSVRDFATAAAAPSAPGPAGCECGHAQTGHAFSDDVCAVPECPCDGYRRTRRAAPTGEPWTVTELAAALDRFYGWFTVVGGGARVQGQLLGADAEEFARVLHAGLEAARAHRE